MYSDYKVVSKQMCSRMTTIFRNNKTKILNDSKHNYKSNPAKRSRDADVETFGTQLHRL